MDWDLALRILGALGGTSTIVALWRWAVAQGRKEAIAEQVQKTLAAKDAEIAELREDKKQLEAWVEALTRPPGRSS